MGRSRVKKCRYNGYERPFFFFTYKYYSTKLFPFLLIYIHKRQVKKTLVKWWWYGSHLTPHTAAVQFLLLQFDIWLPKKGERRRRRSRRWDCGGCWGLKAVLRKLDFHAAVKRPAGVEIGYTALLPEAVERCEVSPYDSLFKNKKR